MIRTFEEYKPKLWTSIGVPNFRDVDDFEKIGDRYINAINNISKKYTEEEFQKTEFFTGHKPYRMTHGREIHMRYDFRFDIYIYLQHDNYFIINANSSSKGSEFYRCDYLEGIEEWFNDHFDKI